MNTDAKIYAMIDDLSQEAALALLSDRYDIDCTMEDCDNSPWAALRDDYEIGRIAAEEIIAAHNDDTWNGKD